MTTARARERELQALQSYSCYTVTRGVTRVTVVTVTSIFSLNPLFVEKVEQNHRKAKFVGSPFVVGKMIATHF